MRRKRIETSKLLLWILLSVDVIVTIVAVILSFYLKDASPLIALIPCVASTTDIGVGFYYWKAKNENLHKYKQDNKIGDT